MGNAGTRIAAAVLVASLLVLLPATAVAGTRTYRFTISGTEVSATSTTGRFVGAASGSALGTWYAEVVHDPLGASANIRPGGSFGMALHQAAPAYLGLDPGSMSHSATSRPRSRRPTSVRRSHLH